MVRKDTRLPECESDALVGGPVACSGEHSDVLRVL